MTRAADRSCMSAVRTRRRSTIDCRSSCPAAGIGTTQPKFDGRIDYDWEDGRRLSLTGGFAGTEGIMHSGIGPFDINDGSTMGYGRVNYTRRGLRGAFFTNVLDGQATNLLTRGRDLRQIGFDFETRTTDFELSNVHTFAQRHVVSYGGNLRFNNFE